MSELTRLKIHSLGAQGDGFSIFNGEKIYVDGVLEGEEIDATIDAKTNRATLKSVITPSPNRVAPPCPHFAKCGGCRLQHMDMAAYQSWKYDGVKGYLEGKNIIPKTWNKPIFIPANTRRRVTLSALKQGDTLIMGYHQGKSHMIFNVTECALLTPELQSLIPVIKSALTPIIANKQKLSIFLQHANNGIDMVITGKMDDNLQTIEAINALSNATNIIRISRRDTEKQTPETMIERIKPMVTFGALSVPLAPLAFLQPSKDGEVALAKNIQDYLPDDSQNQTAIDLFSGCGTFTGHLKPHLKSIDAFEGDKPAIANLKHGGHKTAYVRDLFRDPLTANELSKYDIAIIDPPRAGALEQTKILAESDIKTIIAISCNPATFARDAQILIDGGYRLEAVTIIDQFIWSPHSEIAAKFIQD